MIPQNPPIEPDTGEPWEPWTPKKGDRVTTRTASECVCPTCGTQMHQGSRLGHMGTVERINGRIPVLQMTPHCGHSIRDKSHRFGVRWDDMPNRIYYSAAIELIPLEGE